MLSVVYYTDNCLPPALFALCRDQLQHAAHGLELVTVGLNQPAGFGDWQASLNGARSILTMHLQIMAGLSAATGDYVFLAEHDVLYHSSHFDFVPPDKGTYYYNTNVWHVRYPEGPGVYYYAQQVSGLCASRALLVDFYHQRIEQIRQAGHNRHYEPGLKQTVGGRIVSNRKSEYPNLDLRHGANLTASKWSRADFRDPRYAEGWQEADTVPGWGKLADLFRIGV